MTRDSCYTNNAQAYRPYIPLQKRQTLDAYQDETSRANNRYEPYPRVLEKAINTGPTKFNQQQNYREY